MHSSVAYKQACYPQAQPRLRTEQSAVQAYLTTQGQQPQRVPVRARGDLKWPPPAYRKTPADSQPPELMPTPRLPKKDYTQFFAQNQLPESHCGYKVAPGTLHITPEEGRYMPDATSF